MKEIEVVAAIIHDDEGRIFATQRGYGDFKDGWEFPGGKMEPGESPEEALKREIRTKQRAGLRKTNLRASPGFLLIKPSLRTSLFVCGRKHRNFVSQTYMSRDKNKANRCLRNGVYNGKRENDRRMNYKFKIIETFSKSVEVDAETEDDAFEKVRKKYEAGRIKLDAADDFDEWEIYPCSIGNLCP